MIVTAQQAQVGNGCSYLQIITVVLNYSQSFTVCETALVSVLSTVSPQTQALSGAICFHRLWHANLNWFVRGHLGNAASNSTSTAVGMSIAVDTCFVMILPSSELLCNISEIPGS
jgi:hypothetical protein